MKGVSLFVVALAEGHTFEEVQAFDRNFGPGSGWPPDFISLPIRSFGTYDVELGEKQQLHAWTLDAGSYVVMVDITQPWSHFSCAELTVTS